MPDAWVSQLALPAAVALAGAAAPVLVLHVALGHAMRARGYASWRLRDSALVSPLLVGGLLVGFASLAHGVARAAADRPSVDVQYLASCVVIAGVAFVVAGFGARAVGKLY